MDRVPALVMFQSRSAFGVGANPLFVRWNFDTRGRVQPFAEIAGGIALILGFQTRLVALALIPVLLGATWVHAGNGWVFSAANGGWEYPLFLIVVSFVVALLGDGKYALGNAIRERSVKLGAYA